MSNEEIKFDALNYRTHDEKNLKLIKKSLKELGAGRSIVIDAEGEIIAGNATYKQARELGLPVQVIETDGKRLIVVKRTDLKTQDKKRKRLALMDNSTSDKVQWDFDHIAADFDLSELPDFGIEALPDMAPVESVEEDEAPEVSETAPRAKKGDIWKLGEHRLMCGDSSSSGDVEKLMNGEKADMVFTDPPYNISYRGIKDKRTIKNDRMDEEEFLNFLRSSLMKVDIAYVCCSWHYSHLFKKAMEDLDMPPKAMIIWNKVNPAQHLDKYFKQHEIIFYYGAFGGEKTIRGDIWEVKRQKNTVHPTMKPIELIAMAIRDNPDKKKVYDGFGGSGSTLIACEQLNRKCFMMEIDPKYCDVIITRWEALTGKQAKLIQG